jgi:hypothetical protein
MKSMTYKSCALLYDATESFAFLHSLLAQTIIGAWWRRQLLRCDLSDTPRTTTYVKALLLYIFSVLS